MNKYNVYICLHVCMGVDVCVCRCVDVCLCGSCVSVYDIWCFMLLLQVIWPCHMICLLFFMFMFFILLLIENAASTVSCQLSIATVFRLHSICFLLVLFILLLLLLLFVVVALHLVYGRFNNCTGRDIMVAGYGQSSGLHWYSAR